MPSGTIILLGVGGAAVATGAIVMTLATKILILSIYSAHLKMRILAGYFPPYKHLKSWQYSRYYRNFKYLYE